jgi:SAM-dependent methyltransferase
VRDQGADQETLRRHRRDRAYFGDFDPFGDFDLIFGAAKQNLKIIEVPIHYAARSYGETNISRFRDGLTLLRMVAFRLHEAQGAVSREDQPVSDNPGSYRQMWQRKASLRAVYGDIYRRMLNAAAGGPILEIGGGSGNFKSFAPEAVSTDIVSAPWLDAVCDAQRLPFAPGTFANVVMVDVLHHVEYPARAMNEFARVLRKGGRLIFCEPAITP